jgi:ElaB/YqjD/DUF883 family membrane-anchored ribosome-binding protein
VISAPEGCVTNIPNSVTEDPPVDIAALRQEIDQLSAKLGALLRDGADGAGHRIADAVGDTKDRLAGTAAEARQRFDAAGAEIESHIERNPLVAMLVSFGIGVALGVLSRPRRR